MNPVTISVIALTLTAINATTGILNFVLSRVRLLRVREIRYTYSQGVEHPNGEGFLTVDVLNYGASIWDIEVWIELMVPEFIDGQLRRTPYRIQIPPLAPHTNPLNSGQGTLFELRRSKLHLLNGDEMGKRFLDRLKHMPLRDAALCVYCSGRRKRLRRLCSFRFHWELHNFFDRRMTLRWPLWREVYVLWQHRHLMDAYSYLEPLNKRLPSPLRDWLRAWQQWLDIFRRPRPNPTKTGFVEKTYSVRRRG